MYTTVIDDVDFAVKPMNCPGGMLVYASEPHSYKELPLRMGEIGLVHRHELRAPSTASLPHKLFQPGRRPCVHDPGSDAGRDPGDRPPL